MIPVGDDNSKRNKFPFFTYALLLANGLFFYLELSRGSAFVEHWAFVPSRFLANPLGETITIYSSMFLHGGWLHLGSNMLYLVIFGDNVESRFGHFKFLVFYLLSGTAAVFAQFILNMGSSVPFLGASGAIAGVLAGYLLLFPKNKIWMLLGLWVIRFPAIVVIGIWFILQFMSSLDAFSSDLDGGGIAYIAHIGGFLAGFLMTFFFK
jgi:membrane associated rhomboid family serine protease